MKRFAIISDSSCDLDKEKREKYDIDYIPMRILFDDKDYPASLDYEQVGYKEFFDLLRNGTRIKTAQINVNVYYDKFEEIIKGGEDVLYVACSSGLSNSYKSSLIAKEEILQKYPDAKIEVVDTLNGCLGVGLLAVTASLLREQGKTIEEARDYLEQHKMEMNQIGSVENLIYLKRAGRVSMASAFFGGLLQFKPIIISDINGMNTAVEKVKGRKKSFERMVEMFKELYVKNPIYDKLHITNADCPDDAELLKSMIHEANPEIEIEIEKMGPIIGASTGPGMIAIYFYGKEVTFDGNKK